RPSGDHLDTVPTSPPVGVGELLAAELAADSPGLVAEVGRVDLGRRLEEEELELLQKAQPAGRGVRVLEEKRDRIREAEVSFGRLGGELGAVVRHQAALLELMD